MKCTLCKVEVGNEADLQQHYLVECPRMTSNPGPTTTTTVNQEHGHDGGGSFHSTELTEVDSKLGTKGDEKRTANIVFRWYKTVPVSDDQIHLLTSYGKGDAVLLQWNPNEVHFASDPTRVPVGTHSCQLVLGNDIHQLSSFNVKQPTRDITLIIQSNADTFQTMNTEASLTDTGDHTTGPVHQRLIGDQPKTDMDHTYLQIKGGEDGRSNGSVDGYSFGPKQLDSSSEHGSLGSQRSGGSCGSKHSPHQTTRHGHLSSELNTNHPSVTNDHELSEIFRNSGRGNTKYDRSSQGTLTPADSISEMGSMNSIPSSIHSSNHPNSFDLDFMSREHMRVGGGDSHSEIVRMGRDHLSKLSQTKPNSLPDRTNYKDYLFKGLKQDQISRQTAQAMSFKMPLVTSRASSVTMSCHNSSQNSSLLSLTRENHVPNGGVSIEDSRADDKIYKEMQCNIEALQSMLKEKEKDIGHLQEDLRDVQQTNETLLNEREQVLRNSKDTYKKELNGLLRDKETHATEVLLLRQQLMVKSQSTHGDHTPHSLEFNPDHPSVLRKRIADLESQMSDLQEANECAESQLQKLDIELEKSKEENASLKMVNVLGVEELTSENDKLKQTVEKLSELKDYKIHYGHNRVLEDELNRLRKDTRALREANHTLEEENIKLREDLVDLERDHEHLKTEIKDRKKKKVPTATLC